MSRSTTYDKDAPHVELITCPICNGREATGNTGVQPVKVPGYVRGIMRNGGRHGNWS